MKSKPLNFEAEPAPTGLLIVCFSVFIVVFRSTTTIVPLLILTGFSPVEFVKLKIGLKLNDSSSAKFAAVALCTPVKVVALNTPSFLTASLCNTIGPLKSAAVSLGADGVPLDNENGVPIFIVVSLFTAGS